MRITNLKKAKMLLKIVKITIIYTYIGKNHQSQTLPFAVINVFWIKANVLHHVLFYLPT